MNANDLNALASDLAFTNMDPSRVNEHMLTDDLYMAVCCRTLTVFNPHNAGKRGKKVDVLRANLPGNTHSALRRETIRAILDMTTLDEIVAYFKKMEDLHAGKDGVDRYAFWVGVTTKRGIDVESPFHKERVIRTDKVRAVISSVEFSIRDLTDHYNEPTLISTSRSKKTDIQKLHKDVTVNPSLIEGKTFGEIWTMLQERGLRPHHYYAVD